ncbi:RNA-binding S4 domain-containing protein [Hyphomicrobium sp. DMF-1]|jgi:ribosome-associated heat shock protein Hsp15|uniref:RNA-binding S4 domain-containing protein n=1 Tax=Hyphomicrobium sp. DMF-1 TaxID=3019544 RepID=UPI0022EC119F|nr:RNA-binding S4 domain-containing protein [Hyphomicrobium sp. DMF-1]WBT38568.1 RNA-binding S4 domain-containing protein [Hyphomicrobium sp. DMF-1]
MTKPAASPAAAETGHQRLDKWLWFARVAKSRTLAATAVTEGKIKVNRVKAEKASQAIKIGDVVTSRLHRNVRVLKVLGLGERRGPAAEAQLLYEDLTPRAPPAGAAADTGEPMAWGERAPGAGRPTKRERRQIDELKRST